MPILSYIQIAFAVSGILLGPTAGAFFLGAASTKANAKVLN